MKLKTHDILATSRIGNRHEFLKFLHANKPSVINHDIIHYFRQTNCCPIGHIDVIIRENNGDPNCQHNFPLHTNHV